MSSLPRTAGHGAAAYVCVGGGVHCGSLLYLPCCGFAEVLMYRWHLHMIMALVGGWLSGIPWKCMDSYLELRQGWVCCFCRHCSCLQPPHKHSAVRCKTSLHCCHHCCDTCSGCLPQQPLSAAWQASAARTACMSCAFFLERVVCGALLQYACVGGVVRHPMRHCVNCAGMLVDVLV